MRAFILVLIFACAMTGIGYSDAPAPANDAVTAKAVADLLHQQCALRQGAKYDAYLATLEPGFQIIGPGIVKQTRTQLAVSFASGKRNDSALQKCDVNVVFASKTSDGAYAQYIETDTYPDQAITVYDDAYFASSATGFTVRDVQRYARNVYSGQKLIFGLGKQEFPSTAQLRATPAPPPMPAKDAAAAANIAITKCEYKEASNGHTSWQPFVGQQEDVGAAFPSVNVEFSNTATKPASHVVIAAVVDGDTVAVVTVNGSFDTGVNVAKQLTFRWNPPVASVKAECYITSVTRDGGTWTNPNPPPPVASPKPHAS